MTAATEITALVKRIEVATTPETAFRVFTEEMQSWWPMDTHSIGEDKVAAIVVDPREGGRITERWHDGTEYEWAIFTTWDPPRRFVMDWRPNPDPRRPYTEVEVSFTQADDVTIVELQHRGWERLGAEAADARESYDTGWDAVLSRFTV